MALKAECMVKISATQTGAHDFGGLTFNPDMARTLTMVDGTGAGEADILWMDVRTVASGANDDIDLAGALEDAFGATITMAEVVAFCVINAPRTGAANTTNLTIGGASAAWEGVLGGTDPTIGPIRPGGVVFIGASDAAGIGAVTATTADVLRVANSSGAAATYQIAVIGRSA